MRIEFFSKQNDTKIINFDEGVLILWPFFLRQCHFQNLPLLSQKSQLTSENFHCLASPGKVSVLALKNEGSSCQQE